MTHQGLFDLSGKTALITGASRGIGFAIADALSAAGAQVVLNGRSVEALNTAADQLRELGRQVDTASFDVTDAASIKQAIDKVEEKGPIDILVNNAGIQRRKPLEDFDDNDWRELMSTNLDSVYLVSKAVARHMGHADFFAHIRAIR